MTPEAQRIAIAKACGNGGYAIINGEPQFPDYLSDLNAMHEAEKKINNKRKQDFVCYLTQISCGWNYCNEKWKLINATAPQRAEAFLRTLNLWDDKE